tara:strand:- start:52944 stop:54584 length:1641 start_codon:yes stop_codon:yes gene_type:complete
MIGLIEKLKISLLALLLLSACLLIKAQAASSISASSDVHIAVTELPFSFSPFSSVSASPSDFQLLTDNSRSSSAQYSHLFFDPLVRWGQDKKLQYRLITKIETLRDNNTRFFLKKGIVFHSGNALTSKDVIWSFNEALKNKYLYQKLQHIIEIKEIDDYQLDIQTQLTPAQLLDYMSHLFILDSEFYQKNKIDHNAQQSAISPSVNTLALSGTGPYRVNSFYSDVSLRVEANKTYWGEQPMLTSLNFVKVKSKQSRLYALLAGDVDISEAISNKNINSVDLLDDKHIYQTAPINTLFLLINDLNNPLFADDSVRNAVHLSINQAGMLKHILNGTGTVGNSFASTTFANGQHAFEPVQLIKKSISPKPSTEQSVLLQPIYDTKLAKLLLDTVSRPRKLSLLVKIDENAHTKEATLAIENMLLKVGIKLLVTEVESMKRWNDLQFEHDLMLTNWHTSLLNRDNIYQNIFQNSSLTNYLSLRFNEEKQPLSMQQKIKLFDQYQSQDFIVPLFSQNEIWATDKKFDLKHVFSVNAIPYWHQLTLSTEEPQ